MVVGTKIKNLILDYVNGYYINLSCAINSGVITTLWTSATILNRKLGSNKSEKLILSVKIKVNLDNCSKNNLW